MFSLMKNNNFLFFYEIFLTQCVLKFQLKADRPGSGENIRDTKVQVLKAILHITMSDCLLGQYDNVLVHCINSLLSYSYIHFHI